MNTFLTEPTAFWPEGFISYRIETFDRIVKSVFLDVGKMMTDVPSTIQDICTKLLKCVEKTQVKPTLFYISFFVTNNQKSFII